MAQPLVAPQVRAADFVAPEQIEIVNIRDAIHRVQDLAGQNPDQARMFGYGLIAAWQKAGAHARAAEFAVAAPAELSRDFTIVAYHEWGRSQADQAWSFAIRITEPRLLAFATQSVLSGWSRTDPAGMAEASLAFPEGEVKNAALTKAIRSWMHENPEAAGDWIMSHEEAIPVAEKVFRNERRE